MKILLSIIFYAFMAGTTATVGTDIIDVTPEGSPAAVSNSSEGKESAVKPATQSLLIKEKPVTFNAFGVRKGADGAVITWAAAQQAAFLVQKSIDGKTFTTVASFQPTGEVAHKFCDTNNASALGYYRVQAVSAGGAAAYSAHKKVRTAR